MKVRDTIFLRLILDGISGIKLLLGGSFADFWAVIKAHFAFYAILPKLKRNAPKQVSLIYQKSIVWEYFSPLTDSSDYPKGGQNKK